MPRLTGASPCVELKNENSDCKTVMLFSFQFFIPFVLHELPMQQKLEPLAILPLSFVGFASMPSDPQIIDTDGPTSHRHGMA
jgi:hypothetical protein